MVRLWDVNTVSYILADLKAKQVLNYKHSLHRENEGILGTKMICRMAHLAGVHHNWIWKVLLYRQAELPTPFVAPPWLQGLLFEY